MIIKTSQTLLIISVLILVSCSKAKFDYNSGVLYLQLQDLDNAEALFTRALINNPELDISRYALAYSFLPKEKLKDALLEIDFLLSEKSNDDRRFKLYFAKAVIFTLLGETEQVLRFYQKCLYINPESIRVKTNIELLFSGGEGEGSGNASKSKKSKKKSKKKQSKESDEGKKEKSENDPQSKDEIEKQKKESMKKKNLSPKDLERILKELKQQEKKIRANSYQGEKGENKKDQKAVGDKPW